MRDSPSARGRAASAPLLLRPRAESDGRHTVVYYWIGEDTGFVGASWGVEWCVVGYDRNLATPRCKDGAAVRATGGRRPRHRVSPPFSPGRPRPKGRTGPVRFLCAGAVLVAAWRRTARGRSREQCESGRPYAFVVHGLWPQHESGYPQDCVVPAPRIDDALIRSIRSTTSARAASSSTKGPPRHVFGTAPNN